MSISEFTNLILLLICCIFALVLATFKAFAEISMPIPKQFFLSLSIDKIMHPDPVPISSIFKDAFFGIIGTFSGEHF